MTDYASSKCRITGKLCEMWSEVAGCGLVQCKFKKRPEPAMPELKPCDGHCAECESSYGVAPHLDCFRIELCPFCRQVAGISQSVSTKGWKVICETCGGQTRFFRTPAQAIEAWNRRAGDENGRT